MSSSQDRPDARVAGVDAVVKRIERYLSEARDTADDGERAQWIDLALGAVDALAMAARGGASSVPPVAGSQPAPPWSAPAKTADAGGEQL